MRRRWFSKAQRKLEIHLLKTLTMINDDAEKQITQMVLWCPLIRNLDGTCTQAGNDVGVASAYTSPMSKSGTEKLRELSSPFTLRSD